MFNIKMKGLAPLVKTGQRMSRNVARGIAEGIRESAYIVEAEAKKALTVGDTRALKTGNLRRDTIVRQILPTQATVAPLVNYAIYVHEGTSRMRERPFLQRGVENAQPAIEKIFKKKIQTAIKLK